MNKVSDSTSANCYLFSLLFISLLLFLSFSFLFIINIQIYVLCLWFTTTRSKMPLEEVFIKLLMDQEKYVNAPSPERRSRVLGRCYKRRTINSAA